MNKNVQYYALHILFNISNAVLSSSPVNFSHCFLKQETLPVGSRNRF